MRSVALAILLSMLVPSIAQDSLGARRANLRGLTTQQFSALAAQCVPNAPPRILRAITRAESGFYPLALSVNYPERAANRWGYKNSRIIVRRQPSSPQEAEQWIAWLEHNGYTVSVGLMQVNIEDASFRGLSSGQLLDPCMNLRVGWSIFSSKYQQAVLKKLSGQQALRYALSLYNSGSGTAGFSNGYVNRVTQEELDLATEHQQRRHP